LEQLVRLGICDKIEALAYPKDQTSASEGLSSHQEIESVAPSKSAAILSGMLINPPASDDDTVLSGVESY
jgi:hypothetical protein